MTDKAISTIPQLTPEMLCLAGFEGNDALHRFLTQAGVKTEEDAYDAFQEHRALATGKLKASKRLFTEAIVHLHILREHKLWVFSGCQSWAAYLDNWCAEEGYSTSSVFKFLSLIKIWEGGLGRRADELSAWTDGVYTILPLVDESKDKEPVIAHYDPETGAILAVHPTWAALLPAGDTPQDRVRAYVEEEFDNEDTAHVIRSRMRDQASKEKEATSNGAQTSHGRLIVRPLVEVVDNKKALRDITWELWLNGKKAADGIGVLALNRIPRARELFCQMLGHQWED